MKKFILTCLKAYVIVALAIYAIFAISSGINNWKMRSTLSSFQAINHPASSKLIHATNAIGLLVGNGNHCDFFVGELRTSTASRAAIEKHYQSARVWNPITNRYTTSEVQVSFIQKGQAVHDLDKYLLGQFETKIPPSTPGRQSYIVFFFDGGDDHIGCDIRCM